VKKTYEPGSAGGGAGETADVHAARSILARAGPSRLSAQRTSTMSGASRMTIVERTAAGPAALGLEASDVPLLPRGLHGPRVVVTPDVGHGVLRRYAVEHRQAGERRARPATTPSTGHPLRARPRPVATVRARRRGRRRGRVAATSPATAPSAMATAPAVAPRLAGTTRAPAGRPRRCRLAGHAHARAVLTAAAGRPAPPTAHPFIRLTVATRGTVPIPEGRILAVSATAGRQSPRSAF